MAMEERGKGGMNEEERMGASKMEGKGECPQRCVERERVSLGWWGGSRDIYGFGE